jgi:hypothetical protein
MIFYISFFSLIYCYLFLTRKFWIKNDLTLLKVPIAISVLFAGLRGNIGTDTFAYKTFFNTLWNTDDLIGQGLVFAFEPGFILFSKIVNLISNNDQFFIFIISVVYGILFYKLIKKIEEKDLFFLYYLSSYYIMFNLNLLRFSIAILLLGLAFVSESNRKKTLYFCLGLSFHYSIIFSIFFFIKKKHIFKYLVVLILFVLLSLRFIQLKINNYLIDLLIMKSFKLELTIFLEVAFLFFVIRWNSIKLTKNNLLFCIVLYFILRWFGYLNEVIPRVSFVFGFVIYLSIFRNKLTNASKVLVTLMIVFFSYRSLSFVYNSDSAMDKLLIDTDGMNSLHAQTKWIPYKFFWE